jgi:hypothetical protein
VTRARRVVNVRRFLASRGMTGGGCAASDGQKKQTKNKKIVIAAIYISLKNIFLFYFLIFNFFNFFFFVKTI